MSQYSLNQFPPFYTAGAVLAGALLASSAMAAEQDSHGHDVEITVNEIAMLDLSGSGPVTFEISAPQVAGSAPSVQAISTNQRLFFTSIVNENQTRNITVSDNGSIPTGLLLELQASVPNGVGTGAIGTAVGGDFESFKAIADSGSQLVIRDIGSGFTGTGGNDGAQLNYNLLLTSNSADLEALFADNHTVTLTYTMGVGQ